MQNGTSLELAPSKFSLYKGLNYEAFIPNPPKIPLKEGLGVQISGAHDKNDPPKNILKRFCLSLGATKAIAESGQTPDFWANTRITEENEVHAFGRVPKEDSSWRKPVDTNQPPQNKVQDIDPYNKSKLENLFRRYLPLWDELSKHIKLFSSGINGKDIPYSKKEEVVWSDGRFEVALFRKGHLSGFHLMISPIGELKDFERQWQTINETAKDIENHKMIQEYIQATLEASAIALGVRELITSGRGEIHNSGNWAKGLKSSEEGGQLKNPDQGKIEKARHFTRINLKDGKKIINKPESSFGTSMHVHIYIPEKPGQPVILPKMSLDEAKEKGDAETIKLWESIIELTDEQIESAVRKISQGKLNQWLKENCQGSLQ